MHLKQMPLVKLVIAFIAGILVFHHVGGSVLFYSSISAFAFLVVLLFRFISVAKKYSYQIINTIAVFLLAFGLGGLISWNNAIKNDKQVVSSVYAGQPVLATINEPLVTKPKSYKAEIDIDAVLVNNEWQPVKGNAIVYFKKDDVDSSVGYGKQIIISAKLNEIKNSGNPAGFDYKTYCERQGILYQAYVTKDGFINTGVYNGNAFAKKLNELRLWIVQTLQKYIDGDEESAVAEALLIGYKNDLDKELVQAYSNVGVVHIIAISGLHIGMIYAALLFIFSLFKNFKGKKIIQPVVILVVLWAFTFLAGMVPSILRSAVMFTFIIAGTSFGRRTNIYNTLAASAFCMLAYNPSFLWDAGFQLSYAAVLSIVLYYQHLYTFFYIKNKLLRFLWSLVAMTLVAQIFTTPIAMYHFHQFPNLFLFANIIIVPLSTVILFGALLLVIVSAVPLLGNAIGFCLFYLLKWMNMLIRETAKLDFAVTEHIQINFFQFVLLMLCAILFAAWLLRNNKKFLYRALSCLVIFFAIRSIDLIVKHKPDRLIVYNINKKSAIDVMQNGRFTYYGDTLDNSTYINNVRPARTYYRSYIADSLSAAGSIIYVNNKKIVLVNNPLSNTQPVEKIIADAVIISGNPKLYMSDIARVFDCKLYVFDATNPAWKTAYWKQDCDSLHLRHHSVAEQGAYIAEW